MKTNELTGLVLDWAVATANGDTFTLAHEDWDWYSSSWEYGGPIIEREGISTGCHLDGAEWFAKNYWGEYEQSGSTLLIAAMRCYVASKLGDNVEIPFELLSDDQTHAKA